MNEMDEMEMSDREHDGIRVRAVGAMVEETGTAPTRRVLFEDCYEVPSPTPIEEMSPGALESVMAKSPSSMRLGGDFDAATPQSPMATAFAMIGEFLESPKREDLVASATFGDSRRVQWRTERLLDAITFVTTTVTRRARINTRSAASRRT